MQPADLNLTSNITGYQQFLFVRLPQKGTSEGLARELDHLGKGMENLHDLAGHPSEDALRRGCFQFLRTEPTLSAERDIPHPALMEAHGLMRLEATFIEPLRQYEEGLRELVEPQGGAVESLAGVQRPRSYTSYAMTQFAYAHALPPGPGAKYPLGVVTPLNKDNTWWAMDWLRRESFFLPRYDEKENLIARGHALAAEAGIPCITRRLAHSPDGYGHQDSYDFVGYFEFAEEHAPTFRTVMAALRDTAQNPEWAYVREGPEWWGRRVRRAAALWEKG